MTTDTTRCHAARRVFVHGAVFFVGLFVVALTVAGLIDTSSHAETLSLSQPSTSTSSLLAEARQIKLIAQDFERSGDSMHAASSWTKAGKAYGKAGVFSESALCWTEAARLYEKEGQRTDQTIALIQLGHTLQKAGLYKKALTALYAARDLVEHNEQPVLHATVLGQLGTTAFALGNESQAINLLTDALTLARKAEQPALAAVLLNDLGNALASQDRRSDAISAYMESSTLAKDTSQPELSVTALTNAALASLDEGQVANATDRLDRAYHQSTALSNSHEKAYGMINLGLAYDDLRPQISPEHIMLAQLDPQALPASRGINLQPDQPGEVPPKPKVASPLGKRDQAPSGSDQQLFRNRSEELFRSAHVVAVQIGDLGAQSYSLGYLGQLSERDQKVEEALELTRKAVFAAQQANAPESLYRWQWQTGRLLRTSGKGDEAIQAYRRAISTLQPIRYEFSTGYRGRRYSFRDSIGPVFFELADLLLKQASSESDPKQREAVLIQARDTSELFKAAELQDYFKDECVKSARTRSGSHNELPSGTAIIYPVILPDRVELLLNTRDGWTSTATTVSASRFNEEGRAFRNHLQQRSSQEYLRSGQQLYAWLIKPIEQQLKAADVHTLVFVPDGVLRSIPMAALHDGKEFLIQRYAVATTPGIDLTDFRPIDRTQVRMLALGLSEGVQGFPPLPNVKPEIEAVKGLYGGKSLLDSQFMVGAVETEMQGQEYNVVHIASHGLVGNDARDSFLLAYDDKITMDRLSQMIGVYQFRKSALELLTLSACETAVGDDRAALGLAGVAVKSGARSALASLWFIDDEATSLLVAEFYRQLQNPSISKAKALQQAQLKIASDPLRQHPSFWAPFLLINNWL